MHHLLQNILDNIVYYRANSGDILQLLPLSEMEWSSRHYFFES